MKLWIARDYCDYGVYAKEPTKEQVGFAGTSNGALITLCDDHFEMSTHIKLKEGQFCQIEVKQVGDVYYFEGDA